MVMRSLFAILQKVQIHEQELIIMYFNVRIVYIVVWDFDIFQIFQKGIFFNCENLLL